MQDDPLRVNVSPEKQGTSLAGLPGVCCSWTMQSSWRKTFQQNTTPKAVIFHN